MVEDVVVPVWAVVAGALVVVSAGLLPKGLLVVPGALVDVVPAVDVVGAGAAVVLAAGAVLVPSPPKRPPEAGADVAVGAEDAGADPKRFLAGAEAVVAVEVEADEDAPPNKPPLGLLAKAAPKGFGAAVLAGVVVLVVLVCPAGFWPKRLALVEAAGAACEVLVKILLNILPAVEVVVSGFFPNSPPAPELLSFAAPPNKLEGASLF